MQQATAVRWRRYGKDRLYVNAPDGTRIGWRDLLTGTDHIEPGAQADVYHGVVAAWVSEQSASEGQPLSGAVPDAGSVDPAEASPTTARRPSNPARGDATDETPAADATASGSPADVTDADESMQEASPGPSLSIDADTPEGDHDLDQLLEAMLSRPEATADDDGGVAGPAEVTEQVWDDLADRHAGAAARAEALRLRHDKPIRTVVARVLRVHTDERAWRIGADGEEKVAARLAKLYKRDPRWRFLHAIPVGERGSDIDHLVIGPPGVFTVNSKHHPGAKIWIGGDTFMVNGQRQPYVRNSRFEARRAAKLLSAAAGVPVVAVGVVVPVNAAEIRVKKLPADVMVVNRMRLVRWLDSLPVVLSLERIDTLYAAARRSTTWQPT